MKKRNLTRYVIALLVLLMVAILWLRPFKDDSETSQANPSEFLEGRDQDQAVNRPDSTKTGQRSAEDWTPPAVFSQTGTPSPQISSPRGENASRIYQNTSMKEVGEPIALRPPAVLAMTPEDGRLHLLPEEIDVNTLVARRMVLDTAALDAVVNGETSRILAPTTGDEVLTLEIHRVKTRSSDSHTLMGRIAGEPEFSDVQLVYHDGVIHGNVSRYDKRQYLEYRNLPDGHMMVRELDSSTMTSRCGMNDLENAPCDHTGDCNHGAEEAPPTVEEIIESELGEGIQIAPQAEQSAPAGEAPPLGGEVAAETAGYNTIDIVVGYGQAARIAQGGYSSIEALIIGSVDRMNTAFGNSQITSTEIMLLGTIEDPDYVFNGTDSNSQSDELDGLKAFNDGVLDTVSDFGTQLGTDFYAFVMKDVNDSAGLANRPGYASVSARTYMTANRITFVHEVGHNLGCTHGWGDGSQDMNSNYGWRIQPAGVGKVRTIMAYDWGWERIPYFSNPAVNYGGVATGAVDGFDVQDEPLADQRYRQGGYSGPNMNLMGFDGSNPTLGANNAEVIKDGIGSSGYGAAVAAARATRAISVASPIAGRNWSTSGTQNILFLGGDYTDLADIDLYKNGSLLSNIASSLNPATGRNYAWTIPSGLTTGSDYMIRITLNHEGGGTTTIDSSLFTITNMAPNTVAVVSPNGGGSYEYGETLPITWTSGLSSNVKIELLQGGSNPVVLANNKTDDGYYLWTVSPTLTPASDYTIRVSSVSNSFYNDVSNSNFSITLPPSSNTIATLPYAESFESSFGKWVQSTDDDSNWTRKQGTTASDFTGPTAASDGNYYIYTEASGFYNSLFEISTWVNLVGAAGPELAFDYHMQDSYGPGGGNFMGTLECQVTTDGANWATVFTRTAHQGSTWLSATVDLSAYTNQYVKLRFKGLTGGWAASDMAIDNITINDQVVLDHFDISSIASPQTVDQAINGITITAKTSSGFTVTGFNGTVTFGGTSGISGTSASFTNGVLSGVSVTPSLTGVDRTLTVTGSGATGSATFTVQSANAPVANAGSNQSTYLTGSSWSPSSLSPALWLDAADASTIASSAGKVSQWDDKSPNNRHATQTTDTAFRPSLTSNGLNGKNIINFNGTSEYFDVDLEFMVSSDHSAFIVTKPTNYTDIYGAGNPSAGASSLHVGFDGSTKYRMNYWGNDYGPNVTSNVQSGTANLLNFTWLSNTSKQIMANGKSEGFSTQKGTIATMSGGGRLGKVVNHGHYGGDIAEFIVFDKQLTTTERQELEGFLAHKWGTTGLLAVDHPYKSTSPSNASGSVTLSGSASDDDPGDSLTITWSKVSGPGTVTFGNPDSVNSTASFSATGTYILEMMVSDGVRVSTSTVEIIVGQATPFMEWSNSGSINSDDNGDGIANGMAWVLGANAPEENALAKLPFQDKTDPTYYIFTYRRNQDALNDFPNTTITMEYGDDLSGWAPAQHNTDGVLISVTENIESGIDEVEVKIPKSLSATGKFFGRLTVVITE